MSWEWLLLIFCLAFKVIVGIAWEYLKKYRPLESALANWGHLRPGCHLMECQCFQWLEWLIKGVNHF
jgi:hypothetical protein